MASRMRRRPVRSFLHARGSSSEFACQNVGTLSDVLAFGVAVIGQGGSARLDTSGDAFEPPEKVPWSNGAASLG